MSKQKMKLKIYENMKYLGINLRKAVQDLYDKLHNIYEKH